MVYNAEYSILVMKNSLFKSLLVAVMMLVAVATPGYAQF